MKRPAMRGTQHEAIPRHRSTWNLARFAHPTRSPSSQEPVTSRMTTARAAAAVARRPQTVPSPRSPLIRLDATWPDEPVLSCDGDGQAAETGHPATP